ncbi:hypothetical protein AB0K51_31795 [Kitasatospora sp. NPDC049285]|uniref:hypothetical protein n=1 Tax=Kitasatospora sp. NPDC049285 TaxID=3157096 RepID=UPI00342780D2
MVRVDSGGTVCTVLGPEHGLENPTSIAVRAGTVYVASAAYKTHTDPNLLLVPPRRPHRVTLTAEQPRSPCSLGVSS